MSLYGALRDLHSFPTRRSSDLPKHDEVDALIQRRRALEPRILAAGEAVVPGRPRCQLPQVAEPRSEEHTSELQSQSNLVCRLLLEKKNARRCRARSACSSTASW